jgi:hypothetical protein
MQVPDIFANASADYDSAKNLSISLVLKELQNISHTVTYSLLPSQGCPTRLPQQAVFLSPLMFSRAIMSALIIVKCTSFSKVSLHFQCSEEP